VDTAGGVLDDGEAVQPGLQDRLGVEEVGGRDSFRLGFEELGPGGVVAAGRWIESGLLEDRPYGGGGDLAAEAGDFPGDALVASGRILGRRPQDQGSDGGAGRWSSRLGLGVGAASLHQIGVPAQERPRREEQMVSTGTGQ
jgi:hypothetical protein